MIKLGIIYGGISTEHDISKMSAKSIIENLDKTKYEIKEIYINKQGKWFEIKGKEKVELHNLIVTLKELDVIFPVLHGLGGEDGTIQGLFEMVQRPYVGCGVLASSIGMDKVYTKIIFEKAKIPQAKYIYIKKVKNSYSIINEQFNEEEFDIDKIIEKIKFPMFVKPSNSGSSVGVKKAKNKEELRQAIENAAQFDNKILVEQGIEAKEVECAILQDRENIVASTVGEIKVAEEFYSYDAKYNEPKSKTIIPANISEKQRERIKELSIKAFKAIDGKDLARVDFFIEKETNKIYINEINTMPGFTQISMYPKLFEAVGVSYTNLLNKLVENELQNTRQKDK